MKTAIITISFVLLTVYASFAQRTINLNSLQGISYQEITITKEMDSTFNGASRLRELMLNPKVQQIKSIHVADTILLDLFNNKQYKAFIDKIDVDVNGTLTIRARLADYGYAYCVISTCKGKSFLSIEVPENKEFYLSKYNHQTGKYYLLQIDKS
jgi:hypothetical protein